MSNRAVAKFFKEQSFLELSVGQDGLLGYFADNYLDLVGMKRAILFQTEDTLAKKRDALQSLGEAETELDILKQTAKDIKEENKEIREENKTRTRKKRLKKMPDADVKLLNQQLPELIAYYKEIIDKEDLIFFRNKPLRRCANYEFIEHIDLRLPGIMEAMVEFDRLIRLPIAKLVGKGLSWATLPLKIVVGAILERTNLGHAGHLIYALVDSYPQIIQQRMNAEPASTVPDQYDEMEAARYSVREKKVEVKTFNYSPPDFKGKNVPAEDDDDDD